MTGSAPVAILPITRSKSQRLVNYKDITWKLLTKKKKALPTCFCFFTECTESIMFWYLYRTYAKVQKPCKKLPQNTRPTQVFWDSVTHTHTHAHTHTPSSIIFTIIWSAWHWYCGIIPSCCNVIMNRFVILIPIICVWMCVCVCVCLSVCPGFWACWLCSPRWNGYTPQLSLHCSTVCSNRLRYTAITSDDPPHPRGVKVRWLHTSNHLKFPPTMSMSHLKCRPNSYTSHLPSPWSERETVSMETTSRSLFFSRLSWGLCLVSISCCWNTEWESLFVCVWCVCVFLCIHMSLYLQYVCVRDGWTVCARLNEWNSHLLWH